MSTTIFRSLVASSILLIIAAGIVDWIFPSLVPESLILALEKESELSFLENYPLISLTIFLPWLMAVLASTIGLCFFKHWARALALYSTLIGFALYPFLGPSVCSALASALTEASSLVLGAVLAVAYYSPLSDRFVPNQR